MPLLQQHQKLVHRFLEIDIWAMLPYITGVFVFIENYIYNDWDFLISLLVLMVLDLITGIWKSIKNNTAVTSIGLRDTAIKVIQYSVFLIVVHVLINFKVDGKTIGLLNYADELGYSFLIIIEAKSILENLQKIDDRLDLSPLIDRLKILIKKKE